MKFEVKTQNDDFSQSSFSFFLVFAFLSFIVIFSSISIKLGSISRNYEINYLCKLITIEKTSGWIIGPPDDKEYAVEPVGVLMIIPSDL